MDSLSKDEFIKLYPNTEFYKILNSHETENGILLKTGLNKIKSQFLLKDQIEEYYKYIDDFDLYWIRQVFLEDDTEITINNNIYIADKFTLGDRFIFRGSFTFENTDEKLMVSKYGNNIKYIDNQTDELCKLAIEQNPKSFIFIKDKTPKICMMAVKKDGLLLQFINEQNIQLCLEAVKQNGLSLKYVKEQNLYICLQAVSKNGLALQYVKEQTPGMCLDAVTQNGLALQYVKEQTCDLCLEAVKPNGLALKFVKEQTPNIISEAITQNSLTKKYIKHEIKCKHCNKPYSNDIFNKKINPSEYFCFDSKNKLLKCENFIRFANEMPFIKNIYEKQNIILNDFNISKEEYLEFDTTKHINYIQIFIHIFDSDIYKVNEREYRIIAISLFDYLLRNYNFLLKYKKISIQILSKFEESINKNRYIDIYNEFNINVLLWHEQFKNAVEKST